MPPHILFQDEALLVVCKPAGLAAVPGLGEHLHDSLALRLQAVASDALTVHRLDMATSGLLVFARGKAVQRVLSHAFAQRAVHKRYVAVVSGLVRLDEGEIDLPLMADWPRRPRQKVDHEHGKPSFTRYRVTARDALRGCSRVELEPVTGRSHQLRVHLCSQGHPILGDALYAPPDVVAGAHRLMLHAQSLRFAHPMSGQLLSFENPAPF